MRFFFLLLLLLWLCAGLLFGLLPPRHFQLIPDFISRNNKRLSFRPASAVLVVSCLRVTPTAGDNADYQIFLLDEPKAKTGTVSLNSQRDGGFGGLALKFFT